MRRADQRNKQVILGPYHKFYIDDPNDDDREGAWKDMTADLAAGKAVGANSPTWTTFRDGISAYAFDDSTMNEMWITFHPNHDVMVGEKFYPHIHWSLITTNTGTVRWGVEYSIAEGHDTAAFPSSTTFYMEHTISSSKQYQHLITECSDAQSITMPDVDSLIMMRIFRDAANAADTLTGDVYGLTMDIHYRADRIGTKGKQPDFNEAD